MEQNDPSRRQYAPQNFTSSQPQQNVAAQAAGQYNLPGSMGRFGPNYLQQPARPLPSSGTASGEAQEIFGFGQSAQYGTGTAMPPNPMQFGQEIQMPESQRQQPQQYPQYGSNLMYSLPQAQPSQATPSSYGQPPQYRQRSNAASETFATQFGVPQTGQYILAAQPGPSGATAPDINPQHSHTQYEQPDYPQSAGSAYASAVMDPSSSGGYPTYAQQAQYGVQQAQPPQRQPQQLDAQILDRHRNQIRHIFTLARDGSLSDLSDLLLRTSQSLLGNAEHLGLTRDEETPLLQRKDRLRLWDEFNRAWLVTLQRQLDMTEDMLRAGRQLVGPESVMSVQTLEYLARELVRLCDSVERFGLVDYQMGVAEDEIMDLILRCLQSLDPHAVGAGDPGNEPGPSTAGAHR